MNASSLGSSLGKLSGISIDKSTIERLEEGICFPDGLFRYFRIIKKIHRWSVAESKFSFQNRITQRSMRTVPYNQKPPVHHDSRFTISSTSMNRSTPPIVMMAHLRLMRKPVHHRPSSLSLAFTNLFLKAKNAYLNKRADLSK